MKLQPSIRLVLFVFTIFLNWPVAEWAQLCIFLDPLNVLTLGAYDFVPRLDNITGHWRVCFLTANVTPAMAIRADNLVLVDHD
jgi:hypothetical protein